MLFCFIGFIVLFLNNFNVIINLNYDGFSMYASRINVVFDDMRGYFV